jgi:hypothetical protein
MQMGWVDVAFQFGSSAIPRGFVPPPIDALALVMCRLGLEALSRPKPALESRAEPKPWWRLMGAHGSGFTFSKPEAGA